MVNIQKSGDSAIKFTFTDNDRYLYDGEITVPLNSLILVFDESNMAVFKKIDGDVFLTFLIRNSNFSSKSDLETFYKDNMVGSTGGGGVTSGDVETMISEATSGLAESSAVTEEISEAVSGKADTTAVTASINAAVSGKMDTSAFNTYSASTEARLSEDEEVTSAALNALDDALDDKADTTAVTASISAAVSGKQDTLIAGTNITISGNVISAEGGGGGNNVIELTQAQYDALTDIDPDAFYIITDADGCATTGQVQTMINTAIATKQDTLVSGTNIKTINNESLLGSGNIDIQGGSSINVVQTTGTSTGDVMSQNAVTSNMALKSAAVGGYQYGATSGVNKIQLKSVSNTNIGNAIYYPKINNKSILTDNVTWAQNNYNFQLVETSAITSSVTSSSTDSEIPSAKAVYDALQEGGGGGLPESAFTAYTAATEARLAEDEEVTAAALTTLDETKADASDLGGLKLVQLTQAQYEALTTKDSSTLYIITGSN